MSDSFRNTGNRMMGSLFKRKNHPAMASCIKAEEKEDSTKSGSGNSSIDKFSPGENMMIKPKLIMFPKASDIGDVGIVTPGRGGEDDSQDDWDNGNVNFDDTSYGTASHHLRPFPKDDSDALSNIPSESSNSRQSRQLSKARMEALEEGPSRRELLLRKKELLRHRRSAIENWVSDRKNGSSRSLQSYMDEDPEEDDDIYDTGAYVSPKAGLRGLRRSQSARKLAEQDHLGTPLDTEKERIDMIRTIEKLQREKKELNDRMTGNRLQEDSVLAMKDETTHRRTELLKESEEQKFHKLQLEKTRAFYADRLLAAEDEVKSLKTKHENALKRIADLEDQNASLTAKLRKQQGDDGSEALDQIQSRGSTPSRSKSPRELRRSRSRESSTERKRSNSRAKRSGSKGGDRDLDRSDRDLSKGRQTRKLKSYNMREIEKDQDLNKNGGEMRSPRRYKAKLSRGYGSDQDLSQENRRVRKTRLKRSASVEKDLSRGYGNDKDPNRLPLPKNSKLKRAVTTGTAKDLKRSSKLLEELNISSSNLLDEDLVATNRLIEELNLSTTALSNWYNGNGIVF